MSELETASDVIDALGGNRVLARRYNRRPEAVSNWRTRGIPHALRPFVDADLQKRGKLSADTAYSTYHPRDVKLPPRKTRGSRRRGTQ